MSPELAETGIVSVWKFTDEGARTMPALMLALTTAGMRRELQGNRRSEIGKVILKFCSCYVLCQAIVFSVGFLIGKTELDNSKFQQLISIAGVCASVLVGVHFAVRTWRHENPQEDRVRNIAYGEFLSSKTKELCILFAISVLITHLVFETIIILSGW